MKHAAGGLDLLRGNQREHRKGADDVDDGDQHSGGEHCTRESFARIANLIAHGGDQLKPGKGEGDLRPEIDGIEIPVRHHVGNREVRDGTVAHINKGCDGGKHQQRNVGGDAARVLQPLADVQADDIQDHCDGQQNERAGKQKCSVLRECGAAGARGVTAHGGAGEQ